MNRRDERDVNTNELKRNSLNRETTRTDEKVSVPIVEEELAVGKRTVETGGVRVDKKVTEVPVHESVNLHEEHVTVERRPVDREVRPEDMRAFENASIEMREHAEEAVVEKRARVVEEVVVGKEATERTEQINDTVRRTDVRIEPVLSNAKMRNGFDSIDSSCRTHYKQNFASSGWDYDTGYSHAYRYGYDLAGSGRDWNSVEPEVRTSWESRNRGTWDRFRDAIRYGFEQDRRR